MAASRTGTPPYDPIAVVHEAGIRSEHAYSAGFAAIAFAIIAWLMSRIKKDERSQSDRWGIFIGHWATVCFLIGLALKREEE